MNTQVYVDPDFHVWHGSFYLYGLYEIFGKDNVKMSKNKLNFPNRGGANFNFIIAKNNKITKFSVDWWDESCRISQECYEWCDVYGKVNCKWELTPILKYPKIVIMAPSFGILAWKRSLFPFYCVANWIKSGRQKNFFYYCRKYGRMVLSRSTLKQYFYNPSLVVDNYVFHVSTLWHNSEGNEHDNKVNARRVSFIRVCRDMNNVQFEGGLVPQSKKKYRTSVSKFEDYLYAGGWMSFSEWLEKIKRSAVVFNTPAALDCHGWKLAEYIALGKAIISTPLINDLPEPLVHGENIHFVDGSEESIRKAVEYIVTNQAYREKLEQGARRYWEQYGTPMQALKLLGIEN
ncbi:hypothetical protein FACS189434_00080 [Bacteroidia bacterium]|nr:hypothetical protein FACS189434_00080 [Bacteroidia bacterium]